MLFRMLFLLFSAFPSSFAGCSWDRTNMIFVSMKNNKFVLSLCSSECCSCYFRLSLRRSQDVLEIGQMWWSCQWKIISSCFIFRWNVVLAFLCNILRRSQDVLDIGQTQLFCFLLLINLRVSCFYIKFKIIWTFLYTMGLWFEVFNEIYKLTISSHFCLSRFSYEHNHLT